MNLLYFCKLSESKLFNIYKIIISMILCSRKWQTLAHEPNPHHHLLLYSPGAKHAFYIFKLKKFKRRVIFCDMEKLYKIQISVFLKKTVLEHSLMCSFM